jgi:hypothetical protein
MTGRLKVNVAPLPSELFSAHILPSCASTTKTTQSLKLVARKFGICLHHMLSRPSAGRESVSDVARAGRHGA